MEAGKEAIEVPYPYSAAVLFLLTVLLLHKEPGQMEVMLLAGVWALQLKAEVLVLVENMTAPASLAKFPW